MSLETIAKIIRKQLLINDGSILYIPGEKFEASNLGYNEIASHLEVLRYKKFLDGFNRYWGFARKLNKDGAIIEFDKTGDEPQFLDEPSEERFVYEIKVSLALRQNPDLLIEPSSQDDLSDFDAIFKPQERMVIYGNKSHKFQGVGGTDRFNLFSLLWEYRRIIKNGKIVRHERGSFIPSQVAQEIKFIDRSQDFKIISEKFRNLIKNLNRDFRDSNIPVEIQMVDGALIIIEGK